MHIFQLFLKRFHDDRYITKGLIQHIRLVGLLNISDVLVDVLELLLHDFEGRFLNVRVILGGFGAGIQFHPGVNASDLLPQQQLLGLVPLDDRGEIVKLAGLLAF